MAWLRLCAASPDLRITTGTGYWQALITEPGGMTVITPKPVQDVELQVQQQVLRTLSPDLLRGTASETVAMPSN